MNGDGERNGPYLSPGDESEFREDENRREEAFSTSLKANNPFCHFLFSSSSKDREKDGFSPF